MEIINFSDPISVIATTAVICMVVFFRYVLVSGLFYVLFYYVFQRHFYSRKISRSLRVKGQSLKEIKWSAITSFIFGLSGIGLVWLYQNGYTQIALSWDSSVIIWSVISLVVALFIHETYYYWLHRWMHRPKIFRLVHKTHHDSIVTSPWTSFSFHPLESILQALMVPFLVLFLPMHYLALLFFLILMTVSATINHLDIEIYPRHFEKNWLGKWIIGATHHSLHHSQFRFNYGLYFTFWDKWMNTESPDFEKLFREKTKGE